MSAVDSTVVSVDLQPGQRVDCAHLGRGTFVEYGPPETACPATHISKPGCRIVYVDVDQYWVMPLWEDGVQVIA